MFVSSAVAAVSLGRAARNSDLAGPLTDVLPAINLAAVRMYVCSGTWKLQFVSNQRSENSTQEDTVLRGYIKLPHKPIYLWLFIFISIFLTCLRLFTGYPVVNAKFRHFTTYHDPNLNTMNFRYKGLFAGLSRSIVTSVHGNK